MRRALEKLLDFIRVQPLEFKVTGMNAILYNSLAKVRTNPSECFALHMERRNFHHVGCALLKTWL